MATGALACASAAWSTGCDSGSCGERDSCPVVDQDPAAGDVVFDSLNPQSFVSFVLSRTPEGGILSSDLALVGEEVVATPGATVGDPIVLKRLRLRLQDFTLSLTNAKDISVTGTVISLQAPVEVSAGGLGGIVSRGTMVHTCANIDGQPWHGSAPLEDNFLVRVDAPDYFMDIQGLAPLVLRADNSSCSRVTLSAGILVSNVGGPSADAGDDVDAGDAALPEAGDEAAD